MKRIKSLWRMFFSVLFVFFAGAFGTIFTTSAIPTWYASLTKPTFNPPNWIFGPVWTILYIMMAVALFLVWDRGLKGKRKNIAVVLFVIHLFVNAFWSVIFFGLHNPLAALVCIAVLWLMILCLILYFLKLNRIAAYLLLPYFAWVSFASILNLYIVLLN